VDGLGRGGRIQEAASFLQNWITVKNLNVDRFIDSLEWNGGKIYEDNIDRLTRGLEQVLLKFVAFNPLFEFKHSS